LLSPHTRDSSKTRLDEAYRRKYRTSPYLSPMIAARARFATIKIMPREFKA